MLPAPRQSATTAAVRADELQNGIRLKMLHNLHLAYIPRHRYFILNENLTNFNDL